jgi:hypothetical protein
VAGASLRRARRSPRSLARRSQMGPSARRCSICRPAEALWLHHAGTRRPVNGVTRRAIVEGDTGLGIFHLRFKKSSDESGGHLPQRFTLLLFANELDGI